MNLIGRMNVDMPNYNWIKIKETPEWIIDYAPNVGRYRVSYFENGHFVDEVIFKEHVAEVNPDTLVACPYCLVHSISLENYLGTAVAVCPVCGKEVDLSNVKNTWIQALMKEDGGH